MWYFCQETDLPTQALPTLILKRICNPQIAPTDREGKEATITSLPKSSPGIKLFVKRCKNSRVERIKKRIFCYCCQKIIIIMFL